MEEEYDGKVYTVDDALLALGFGKFQVFVFLFAGMGLASDAMEMMLLSFIGPPVQALWGLSSHQESFITSIVFAGMLVGAYSWGVVSDMFGRKRGFLITAIVTSGAGFLSALAPNFYSFLFFRGLVGVGLGGGPVLSSWFLEFVPAPNRGTCMVGFSGFWTFGTILEASIAWIVMPRLGWRWLLAVSALPASLLLIFYGMAPESPRYLCMMGRKSEALAILQKMARLNRRELPPGVLVSDNHNELEEKLNGSESEDTKLVSQSEDDIRSPNNYTGSQKSGGISLLLMLFSPELRKSTLLLWIVFFGNAFCYYGLVLLTTELNNNNNRCMSTKSQSSSQQDISFKDVFITSFAEIPGLLISAVIVDKVGRKRSMSSMFFICFVFLIPLVFHQPRSLTTAILFGARLCISSTFTIVYIYAPEIYPTSVRTTGVGTASSVARIGGMLCPLVAVSLIHGCHQTLAIILFESVIALSGICVWLLPFETKGRELTNSLSVAT